MKFVEKSNEIVLRDLPAQNWARGMLFFLGTLLFGGITVMNFRETPRQSIDGGQIFCLAITLFLLYWTYRKLSLPATVTRVNLAEGIVEITRRRFWIFTKIERIPFQRIKSFELIERKPDRAYLYFNVITMHDGAKIELEHDGNAVEGTARIISVRLNELLKKTK